MVDDASTRRRGVARRGRGSGRALPAPRDQGGAAAARNDGLAAASHELVACIDSDCVPHPGWLDALLPHFADPELGAIAPRIVALRGARNGASTPRARALRGRALSARPRPRARARHPVRPRAVRARRGDRRAPPPPLRRDAEGRGGRGVRVARAVRALRARGTGRARPPHRPGRVGEAPRVLRDDRRRDRASATPARRARCTSRPGRPRPGSRSPRDGRSTAARHHRAGDRAARAASSTTTRPPPTRLAAGGTLRSGRVVADALTRHWWPLSALAALAVPKPGSRSPPRSSATRASSPTTSPTASALWKGCLHAAHARPAAARETLAARRHAPLDRLRTLAAAP